MYGERGSKFSPKGQEWINATRKCLQVKLAPLFRPYKNPTCDEIKKQALNSHSDCYLTPFIGAPSICSLDFPDWYEVAGIVGHAFDLHIWKYESFKQDLEFLCEGFKVVNGCLSGKQHTATTVKMNIILNAVSQVVNSAFTITGQIQDLINKRYRTDDLLAIPCIPKRKEKRAVDNTVDNTVYADVFVMMDQRSKYDLNVQQENTFIMEEAVNYFLDKVSDGEFRPNLVGGVEIKSFTLCDDLQCQSENRTVEQPQELSLSCSDIPSQSKFIALIIFVLVVLF